MKQNYKKDGEDCGDLCADTHKQLRPIMMVLGVILTVMVVYAFVSGAFSKFLA